MQNWICEEEKLERCKGIFQDFKNGELGLYWMQPKDINNNAQLISITETDSFHWHRFGAHEHKFSWHWFIRNVTHAMSLCEALWNKCCSFLASFIQIIAANIRFISHIFMNCILKIEFTGKCRTEKWILSSRRKIYFENFNGVYQHRKIFYDSMNQSWNSALIYNISLVVPKCNEITAFKSLRWKPREIDST